MLYTSVTVRRIELVHNLTGTRMPLTPPLSSACFDRTQLQHVALTQDGG
jgi:hypothetical protein